MGAILEQLVSRLVIPAWIQRWHVWLASRAELRITGQSVATDLAPAWTTKSQTSCFLQAQDQRSLPAKVRWAHARARVPDALRANYRPRGGAALSMLYLRSQHCWQAAQCWMLSLPSRTSSQDSSLAPASAQVLSGFALSPYHGCPCEDAGPFLLALVSLMSCDCNTCRADNVPLSSNSAVRHVRSVHDYLGGGKGPAGVRRSAGELSTLGSCSCSTRHYKM